MAATHKYLRSKKTGHKKLYAIKPYQKVIKPQAGPQEAFLSSPADIVIFGGAAGGGKTYGMLLEPLRHATSNSEFATVIFRRNTTQVKNPGGLWDESMKLYPHAGGQPVSHVLEWRWTNGGKIKMGHLEHEDTVLDWQGAQIPLIMFDELTHFCLTEDHEVLTQTGWKKISTVLVGEKVISYSSDRKVQLKDVLDTPIFDFDGQLVTVSQKCGVSFRATPNHRIVINRQNKERDWGFVEASHLLQAGQMIPRTGNWDSGTEVEWFDLPLVNGQGHGPNSNSPEKVRMDDWLAFLGWYLSEGSSFYTNHSQKSPTGTCVTISQVKPCSDLEELMLRLPWRFCRDNSEYRPGKRKNSFKIFSSQLFSLLNPLGDAYSKRIPRWIFSLSKRQQRLFFDAFVRGDGHIQEAGGIQIGLCNEGLIDDLQEMGVYLGLISTKIHYATKTGFDVYALHFSQPQRHQTQTRPEDVELEQFKGKVHCLTVADNGTFMIRHKGRISWTGNSQTQFFYMLSRNRSMCGIKPYIRASCNPDADSWVATFISWWINQETGFPIPERGGKLRWFIRLHDTIIWADTAEELIAEYGQDCLPKSVTFIPATLDDNKALNEADPGYRANLMALSRVERERLLHGNWKIKPAAGLYFKRNDVTIIDEWPDDVEKIVRRWDLAATEPSETNPNPDWTAGVLMGRRKNGRYIIGHCEHFRKRSHLVRERVLRVANNDGYRVKIGLAQDPGQAGKDQVESYISDLAGFSVSAVRETGDKFTRADPYASQWQAGNIDVLRGTWNEAFFAEHEAFGGGQDHDDQVDAAAGAFIMLAGSSLSTWAKLGKG